MTTDPVLAIRETLAKAASTEKTVILSVEHVRALIESLASQEQELIELERTSQIVFTRAEKLIADLDCVTFANIVPSDDSDSDLFEVFVGEISDCARIWAYWDADEQSFYEPAHEGEEASYREDVVYWRYALPEPHEIYDLGL